MCAQHRSRPVADAAVYAARSYHDHCTHSKEPIRTRTDRAASDVRARLRARDDRPLQGFRPRKSGGRSSALSIVRRRGRPPATRGSGPPGALRNGGSPSHDQANLAGNGSRGLARWRRRRMQHAGHHSPVPGSAAVDRGIDPGIVHGVVACRLRGSERCGSERLLAPRGQTPRIDRSGAFPCLERNRPAPGQSRGCQQPSRPSPRCNARATLRRVHGRLLKCAEPDAAIGSGVVGRRTFNDAAIGDQADSGSVPVRPSGNAALGETMTSTAPHLSVRGVKALGFGPASRVVPRAARGDLG
jgi:hypothetical protein